MSTDSSDRKLPILPIAIVVVAILLLALAWWRGGATPRAEVGELTTQLDQARTMTDEAERERDELRAAMVLREAQVAVLEANIELDRRNFGIANQHIERASQLLATVESDALALDGRRLDAMRESLGATNLNLATDLGEQRQQLLRLAADINELIGQR